MRSSWRCDVCKESEAAYVVNPNMVGSVRLFIILKLLSRCGRRAVNGTGP